MTLVGANGVLKGVGRLGDTTVEGAIAPGNSIGTLTIQGNYVQTATGTYFAELAPGSRSDLLHVTGTASLDGRFVALPEPGIYYLGEQFNLLQADGGVDGAFAWTDFSAFSPFLKFQLAYEANGARIDVARGERLASAATTPNQRAVASAADVLAINQGLPKPLTQLFPEQVGAALDGLSGELHAATSMVLVEGNRYLRDALAGRIGDVQFADGGATGAWLQVLAGSGTLDGDANTARTESDSNGVLVGVDHAFGGWTLGVMAGAGRTDIKQLDGRAAKSKIDNTHAGLYVGRAWGGFGLKGGVSFSWHDVDSSREVGFAGFKDTLQAKYDADSRQAFIEAMYRFGSREGGLEPYLQVARVEVDVDGIHERGGAAALHGRVEDSASTVTTAGLRFDKGMKTRGQQESWLHLRGGLGYRHVSGDRDQVALLGWQGGNAFEVSGAPLDDGAVAAQLGLNARLTQRQQLDLGYSGQFGSDSHDHAIHARWSVQF